MPISVPSALHCAYPNDCGVASGNRALLTVDEAKALACVGDLTARSSHRLSH